MKIRLHDALVTPGYFKALSKKLDFSAEELLTQRGITDAVGEATIEIRNQADIVTVRAFGAIRYKAMCDRCLCELDQTLEFDFTKDARRDDVNENFEGILLESDESFDDDQEVSTEVLISFPSKHLCKADCKGLCPVCGCNLNEKQCSCVQKELDPRLEVLRNLTL